MRNGEREVRPARDVEIVIGFLPPDELPKSARRLGLQRRVAFVFEPVPPDQDIDPALYGALVHAVRVVVNADKMVATLPDAGAVDLTEPGSVAALVSRRMADDGDPLPYIALRRGADVVAVVASEPWTNVGGPAPYCERFAVPVFTRDDFATALVTAAQQVCARLGRTIGAPIQGASLLRRTPLQKAVWASRWFFGS